MPIYYHSYGHIWESKKQAKQFITISCTTDIKKILKGKDWSNEGNHTITKTPMNHEKKILMSLENTEGPTDPNE